VISALERENAELRAQLSALAEQLTAHFTRTIDELTQQIAKLNDRVAELTAAAQRRHQRPRGAKPTEKTAAPPPNLSAEAKDACANRPQPPSLPPKITKQKKPRKPSGRKALPSHLPVDETSLRPEVCDACGGGERNRSGVGLSA
jgi:septal ring factor EnvC (AmiA/AmiB activator)